MAASPATTGAMVSLASGPSEIEGLLAGDPVVIAGYNSPRQTVVSGPPDAVDRVADRARAAGLAATRLRVGHAFHSPHMQPAAVALAEVLAREPLRPLRRSIASTVNGAILPSQVNLRSLLCRQVTAPVRFIEALAAAGAVNLWIEVGPDRVLGRLLPECNPDTPAVSTDAGGPSWTGLLRAAGAAFALGALARPEALSDGRLVRPIDLDWRPRFFVNPCELAPASECEHEPELADGRGSAVGDRAAAHAGTSGSSAGALVRRLVARRAELPLESVRDGDRLLSDLHLNSIAVGELVAEAARGLGLAPPMTPTDYADATVGEAARALEQLAETGVSAAPADVGAHPVGRRFLGPGVHAGVGRATARRAPSSARGRPRPRRDHRSRRTPVRRSGETGVRAIGLRGRGRQPAARSRRAANPARCWPPRGRSCGGRVRHGS